MKQPEHPNLIQVTENQKKKKPLSFETLLKSRQWYNYSTWTGINMDKYIHDVNTGFCFSIKIQFME